MPQTIEHIDKIAREDGWESYRGQLYLDVPIDDTNEKYQLICNHMDNPDGTFKIPGVESWILSLEKALENKHHDEPGFGTDGLKTFRGKMKKSKTS